MRIQTNLNGITTTSAYEEGDCYSLVNLRKKNGTLHPVTPRNQKYHLFQDYDIVFVHQNENYENWIGVINYKGGGFYIGWNIMNERHPIIHEDKEASDNILSVQQIGNTLSFITDQKVFYAIFNENKYVWLGEIPEMQPIRWFNFGYSEEIKYTDEYSINLNNVNDLLQDATKLRNMAIGLYNVSRKRLYESLNGCLFDSHLMVFAFRLYDGSYIKQTLPVLLCGNVFEPAIVNYHFYHLADNGILIEDGDWQFAENANYVVINANKIYLEFDLNYLNNWIDIIKSVDVFISVGLGKSSENNIVSEDYFKRSESEAVQGHKKHIISGAFNLMKDDALMIENIKSNGNFYLIDSIPIGTVSKYDFPISVSAMFNFPKTSVITNLDLLINRETLPVDPFSHHTITGNISYVYNNRLHLANIKTKLFSGFHFDFFKLPDRFFGISRQLAPINHPNNVLDIELITDLRYNGYLFGDYKQFVSPLGFLIVVDLQINGIIYTVYSKTNNPVYFWINPYFGYPDPRAFRARFYSITSNGKYVFMHQIDLTESKSINSAFYIQTDPDLTEVRVMPPIPNQTNQNEIDLVNITVNTYSQIESNKLKVSSLNNPFMFPNEQTYIISNGIILNMASVAIRIAEGQFGQFPLYVFTNKGIYSLQVGSAGVVYATEAAPTSYEVPIIQTINKISTTIICQTPFGVIFTSQRGICIISGQSVELLTGQLRESPKELSIETTPELDDLLKNYGSTVFTEYLKGVDFIIYDPHENEVIVVCKELPFNFVMNFDSKQFYLSTERIDQIVENTFPNLMVIEGLEVKSYAESGSDDAYVSLVTRPLNFGTTDFKKLERMFFRATLYNPVDAVILNYFSLDEVNFRVLKGFKVNPETRKDFDMGLFSRTKYRQFLFAFAGTLNEKSEIKYLETEIDKEYNNTKMR